MDQIGTSLARLGRSVRHAGRLAQILNVFTRHGFWSVIETTKFSRWLSQEQKQEIEDSRQHTEQIPLDPQIVSKKAVHFRQALEELGPSFIKLGQVLATRRDLLPESWTVELEKFHSAVEPLPYSEILKVLRKELGDAKLKDFKEIVAKPIAAGSIGQVHKAILQNGNEIVLKIQRPGIAEQIEADCQLMAVMASALEKYFPELRYLRPTIIIREFERAITSELDFIREASNTTKIALNFKDDENIVIPKVYWDYTNPCVLALEYIEGVNPTDKKAITEKGYDPGLIMERGCNMFLQMVYIDGLFHGDLHPGNILVMEGNRIGLLDFGIAIRLNRVTRENLAGLFAGLIEEDYESVVSCFAELSRPGPGFDKDAFEHAVANTVSPYVGLELSQVQSGSLMWNLASIAARYNAPLPGDLVIFLKTMATFEGIGRQLDPGFDLMGVCQKYAQKIVAKLYNPDVLKKDAMRVARDMSNLARYAPTQVRRLLDSAIDGQFHMQIQIREVRVLAIVLKKAASQIAVSMIIGALVIGSSILSFAYRQGEGGRHLSHFGVAGFSLAAILGLYVVYSTFFGRIKR